MTTVSAYEAKTHFSALLERASDGETVVITKHGRPVARLVPVEARTPVGEVIESLLETRKGVNLGEVSLRDLVEEGRRY